MDLKYLADLCRISYLSPDEIKETLSDYQPKMYINDNTLSFTIKKNNKLIVVFSGTNDKKDLVDDLNIITKDFYSLSNNYCGKIHSGFIDYYLNIRGKLLLTILDYSKEYSASPKEIIFCGHSLGGSCCIAALDISFLPDIPDISCYTFGSPRIGNKTFAKTFNIRVKSTRVVNQYDIVTGIPFFFKYSHVNKKKSLKTSFTFARLKNKLKSLFKGNLSALTGDHDIEEYIKKL